MDVAKRISRGMSASGGGVPKGLRQFLDLEQQRGWLEGKAAPADADERSDSLELRFKYASRFEKLMRRPQAGEVLALLRLYTESCIHT